MLKGAHLKTRLKNREISYTFSVWHNVSQDNTDYNEGNLSFFTSYYLFFKAVRKGIKAAKE